MDLSSLQDKKNLLAFSYGRDSSALFHLLLEHNIDFDLAMVNYNSRPNSKIELEAAKKLAKKHCKKLFFIETFLESSNFEANARTFRYEFFDKIMTLKGYENLLLAHHLNDRVEWFLMRFMAGSGLSGMLGLSEVVKKRGYSIVRPFFNVSKSDIFGLLKNQDIFYFTDESNSDVKFRRNYIRLNWADSLVLNAKEGIKKSLQILNHEAAELYGELKIKFFDTQKCALETKNLSETFLKCFNHELKSQASYVLLVKNSSTSIYAFITDNNLRDLYKIEKISKILGYVISKAQREEILRSNFNVILGDKIIICKLKGHVFVSNHRPNKSPEKIPKNLKALFSKYAIAPKVRLAMREIIKCEILESFRHLDSCDKI